MKDQNIPHIWRLDKRPAGASVWPYLVGHLQSFGESHYHSFPDYFCPHIITRGEGKIKTLGNIFEVKAGDMFTLWPGVEIEYFDDDQAPWEFFYFHIEGSGMQDLVESCGFRKNKIVIKPQLPENVEEVFSDMYKILETPQVNDEYRVLSLLYQLPAFCRSAKPRKKPDRSREILFKAETIIKTQLATGINVNELCSRLDISRITLFRVFQKELSQTPIEYITRARISKAKELLKTSSATMETVSRLSGFLSEKYFLRRFKEATGMRPGKYRQENMVD